MNCKIKEFLVGTKIVTPSLIIDLDIIEKNYLHLRDVLPSAKVYYAVKANPASAILRRLVSLDSYFDAASIGEIEQCLAAGALAKNISFGNTIKKSFDIAEAYRHGIDLFALDSEAEVFKIAQAAPGTRVYCRLLLENKGAAWPLSRKFGCSPEMARDLLILSRKLGLIPYGLSFHVGSQQTDPRCWNTAISNAAAIFVDLSKQGIQLKMLNLGGGFPVEYRAKVPAIEIFSDTIMCAMTKYFGETTIPEMIIEPGRAIAASAGVLIAEVVLVSHKNYADKTRWVYLDIGKFSGLAETMGEAILYDIRTDRDSDVKGIVYIAGPTCDGADILYEKAAYSLPETLKAGDRVYLLAAGAYTSSYASIGFNGFSPPNEYYI